MEGVLGPPPAEGGDEIYAWLQQSIRYLYNENEKLKDKLREFQRNSKGKMKPLLEYKSVRRAEEFR